MCAVEACSYSKFNNEGLHLLTSRQADRSFRRARFWPMKIETTSEHTRLQIGLDSQGRTDNMIVFSYNVIFQLVTVSPSLKSYSCRCYSAIHLIIEILNSAEVVWGQLRWSSWLWRTPHTREVAGSKPARSTFCLFSPFHSLNSWHSLWSRRTPLSPVIHFNRTTTCRMLIRAHFANRNSKKQVSRKTWYMKDR